MIRKKMRLLFIFVIMLFQMTEVIAGNIIEKIREKNLKQPEEIHIYIPFEFQASFFMYADLIKRSPDIKKVIWGDNLFQGKEKDFNVFYVGSPTLSNSIIVQNGFLYAKLDKLKQFYHHNSNAEYHIHTAIFMSLTRLMPIFDIIPKEKIKHIHLYESSVGRTLQRNTNLWRDDYSFNKEDLQTCIKYHCLKTWNFIYSMHLLYPTTYHLGLLPEIRNEPKMKNFIEGTKTATLEDMNFIKLKESLTADQKKALIDIYRVNLEDYKKAVSGKKVNLFIIGHASDIMNDLEFKKFLVAVQDWYRTKKSENELFFIKPGRDGAIMKKLKDAGIDIPEFPISAPFELLILADLVPDSVSGTSCSLFFNLPKEKIGRIYRTDRGNHLPLLEKIFGKEKVMNVKI